MDNTQRRVLVTGAAGFIGRRVCQRLAESHPGVFVLGTDLRKPAQLPAGQRFEMADIRDARVGQLIADENINAIIHLASIVTPPPGMDRATMREIDVDASERLLAAAVAHGVEQFIVTTSGAAYGYHADNPVPLDEDDALRGNVEFAYSDHKRLVEELLARYRREQPQLKQLVFRPGTVLGHGFNNQITALFDKPRIPGVAGTDTPFVIIWDEDVAQCLIKGLLEQRGGIFNLAGDGTISLREIAQLLGKPYLALPAWLMRAALFVLHGLGLSQYGPEQVNFLRYRPVLSNTRLKRDFGYAPQRSSRQCFEDYARGKGLLKN
jgi:UDP-glucose 4-epimerase